MMTAAFEFVGSQLIETAEELGAFAFLVRSEERRVGKECRL